MFVDEREGAIAGVAIPHSEVHLVVRFGPSAHDGLDVHAMGGRQKVHRKLLPSGQSVTARLQLGATRAVLGVPAAAIAGQIVALEDLWGAPAARRLKSRLAQARSTLEAASVLEQAIDARLASSGRVGRMQLVLDAADRLARQDVNHVAAELGVSERHLRRVFKDALGVGPKEFAKLMRFRRAVSAARETGHASWARIAASAGYYDQAHLITEFRAVSGVTPEIFLGELRVAHSIG